MMSVFDSVRKKIESYQAKVGIVGIGYVGNAVGLSTAETGFNTLGFDISLQKVHFLNQKNLPKFSATGDFRRLAECDCICICVPTPLSSKKKPELKFLKAAAADIAKHLKIGQLIILESSVAPGTTRKILLPILEKSKLKFGRDFFLGFSPERVDPGNTKYTVSNIPKIISGIDNKSLELIKTFYSKFVDHVIPVSTPETAEMTKIMENLFRLVNISLVNELSDYTDKIGIDIWEVISAAATKPFGFLPHYPSAGAGGYCIPVLPKFLLESAKENHIRLPLVKEALSVNDSRPGKIVKKAVKLLNGTKNKKNPKVLLVGIAYKEEMSDTRESTALKVWQHAEEAGLKVNYHDPYVDNLNGHSSINLSPQTISDHDLIIITTPHKEISYSDLAKSNKAIIDTRNVFKGVNHPNIYRF